MCCVGEEVKQTFGIKRATVALLSFCDGNLTFSSIDPKGGKYDN